MLSCKEATRLVSDGLDRQLSFRRRLSLRFHVLMCRACSRYSRQITALNKLVSNHYRDDVPAGTTEHVSQDTLQHIKSTLRSASLDTDPQTGK